MGVGVGVGVAVEELSPLELLGAAETLGSDGKVTGKVHLPFSSCKTALTASRTGLGGTTRRRRGFFVPGAALALGALLPFPKPLLLGARPFPRPFPPFPLPLVTWNCGCSSSAPVASASLTSGDAPTAPAPAA